VVWEEDGGGVAFKKRKKKNCARGLTSSFQGLFEAFEILLTGEV
jgi:hypothetical protein